KAARRGGQPPTTGPRPRPLARGRSAADRASRQGRPALLAGAVARKGGRRRSQGQQLAGAVAARGHTRLQRDARKGGRLLGAHKGLPPAASPTTNKGGSANRKVATNPNN
ncbi:hypothetical protein BHE74_00032952, partial [Ensete ventricosum]